MWIPQLPFTQEKAGQLEKTMAFPEPLNKEAKSPSSLRSRDTHILRDANLISLLLESEDCRILWNANFEELLKVELGLAHV